MSYSLFPTEIILLIAQNLEDERDINVLARTNHRYYDLLDPVLYRHNAQYTASSALRWAVLESVERTVRKSLDHGAFVDDNDSDSDDLLEMFYHAPLLCLAAEQGEEGIAKLLLDHGTDPNTRNKSRRPALTLAVSHRHLPVIRLLLAQEGIVVNTSHDSIGHTPLSTAIYRGYVDIAEILLQHGAKFDISYKGGRSPLWEATFSGNEEMVVFVYNGGFDPDYRNNHAPLITAAQNGSAELLRFFLDRGADLEAPDPHGRTPLSIAATGVYFYSKTFETLVALGARADTGDKDGRTPLSWAADSTYIDAVTALVDLGVEIDSRDKQGRTPLSWAAAGDRILSIKTLLDKGANIASRDCQNETPLSRALGGNKDAATVMLLSRNADPSFAATRGTETLLQAARFRLEETAMYLLDNGVRPDPTDETGATPLLLAVEAGEIDIAERLIKTNDVDINIQDSEGRTPLSIASHKGLYELAEVLIQNGAIVDSRDIIGRTPLSYAAETSRSLYELLILNRASLLLIDGSGATPHSRYLQTSASGGFD